MSSVDRLSADEFDAPVRPWVAVAWIGVVAVLVGCATYLTMRPDAWDQYQTDFGCTALTNVDSSYSKARCTAANAADRERLSVKRQGSGKSPIK